MSDRIEPALSAAEWNRQAFDRDTTAFDAVVYGQRAEIDEHCLAISHTEWGPRAIPALIALANAALPDDDPRKITRERVARLRSLLQVSDDYAGDDFDESGAFLDALESYLPPA